jgi:PKD repeat protein
MKQFIIIFSALLVNVLNAQNHEFCGQHHVTKQWFNAYPDKEMDYHQIAEQTWSNIKRGNSSRNNILITIPVVFHILHQDGPENISDEQIKDQIRILNRDYSKQNADTINVVPGYKNNIANVGFQFVLASIDPQGKCTSGIIRHKTPKTNWDANKLEDFIYSWPRQKYLNIYIVKKINIAPAYTFLPGVGIPPSADAIVCESIYVGSIGTAAFDSRAITHEVGHWFGLPHTWGITNAPGVACGQDFVDDTPTTKGFTSCSINNAKVCDPNIEENVQNYMDYSPCKLMFTNGQARYMRQTIESGVNGRDNLSTEANLIATGVIDGKLCNIDVNYSQPYLSVCKGESIPFESNTYAGANSNISYLWTIEGGIPSTSTDSIVTSVFSEPGSYEVKLVAQSAVGTDSITKIIKVYDDSILKELEQSYDFSNEAQASNFEIINIDNDIIQWSINLDIGAENTKGGLELINTNSLVPGSRHYLETPFYDFSKANKPQMSFFYSYARYSDVHQDTFRIEYTLDCGKTWKNLPGVPSLNTMANNSGGINSETWQPTKTEHWRKVTLSSVFTSIFKNKPSAKFRFYFRGDPAVGLSNNIYLDQINIWDASTTSTHEHINELDIEVTPNPSFGDFTVKIPIEPAIITNCHVVDITGQTVDKMNNTGFDGTFTIYAFNNGQKLCSGVYQIVFFTKDGNIISKRIVVL